MKKKPAPREVRGQYDGTVEKPLEGSRLLIFKNFMIHIIEGSKPSMNRVAVTSLRNKNAFVHVAVDLNEEKVWANDIKAVKCTQGYKV